jgi:hypothetical protein
VQASERKQFAAFVEMLGYPEWLTDHRFGSRLDMGNKNADVVEAHAAPWFATRLRSEVFAACRARGIPAAPVRSIGEVLADEALAADGAIVEVETSDGRRMKVPWFPARFDGQRPPLQRAPRLGEQTEALVAIDVNTGKFTGTKNLEETAFKTNCEAAREISKQIRLRDLGGIIIIDFIDMERAEHRDQVFKALMMALADDKARTNVLEISELGLVEMTRKRVRQDLQSLFCRPCPTCKGSGVVKSDLTVAAEIFRKVQAAAADLGGQEILIRVNPEMAQHLEAEEREGLELLQEAVQRKLTLQPVATFDREEYEIIAR